MTEVLIGNSTDYLALRSSLESGAPGYVVARLDLEGLIAVSAIANLPGSAFDGLDAYFNDLESNWRGWLAVKTWESLEGDLRLEARHEHGHVQIRVTIRHERSDRSGWSASGDLALDPGEQLAQVARSVADFAKRLDDPTH